MVGTLNETPRANRLHIGFYGRCNSGKSSLINAFANQKISIVSDIAGTTTDPVYKSMEIYPLGACVLIDTAGFDDISGLGEIRIEKTKEAAEKTDIAVVLFSETDISQELIWYNYFKNKNISVIAVLSKADTIKNIGSLKEKIEKEISVCPIEVSAEKHIGINNLMEQLIRSIPEDYEMPSITGRLVNAGDVVLLCMPQDIQAPKGRLILPQVQTTRDLLDNKCVIISVTTDKLDEALASLKEPPKLIITDSQVYRTVYDKKPSESLLTSFSTLFAAYKGDYQYYYDSAKAIEKLTDKSKVLIAECCTHAPLAEDIGREKIPAMLRKRTGEGLIVDIVSGANFPKDLTGYDLIIQCGACMFNRRYVLSRIERAKLQNIPMTNYGVAIAYLTGIIDFITV